MLKKDHNMQKRGISHHLDWIIGITLFMFFIVFVIATIKPGVQPLHSKDVLLNIIQDKFIENVTWEIQRVPLKIVGYSNLNDEYRFTKFSFPFDWNSGNTRLYNESYKDYSYSLGSYELCVELWHYEAVYPNKLYVLYSNDPIFESAGSSSCPTTNQGTASYGVPETLTGLSEDKIDNLDNYDYEQLKTDWKYPITSDFNITVNLEGHIYEISSGKEPPSNANVYVKQYTDFVLNKDGQKISALVTIKAW